MDGSNGVVITGVDSLVKLLEEKGRMSIDSAAKALGVKDAVLQNWVDFLVEEKIIGVEYQFITPYIFMLKKKGITNIIETREDFYAKAKLRSIAPDRIYKLWVNYIEQNKAEIKRQFFAKAKDRSLSEDKIDMLWFKYEQKLIEENV